jgi:conjugal transfer/entry exclusion protein
MEERYITIENDPRYVKDMYNSAILNTDVNSVIAHKQKKKVLNQINSMQDEINMLKEELQKIKTHLQLS